jgi:hypothetical protein
MLLVALLFLLLVLLLSRRPAAARSARAAASTCAPPLTSEGAGRIDDARPAGGSVQRRIGEAEGEKNEGESCLLPRARPRGTGGSMDATAVRFERFG